MFIVSLNSQVGEWILTVTNIFCLSIQNVSHLIPSCDKVIIMIKKRKDWVDVIRTSHLGSFFSPYVPEDPYNLIVCSFVPESEFRFMETFFFFPFVKTAALCDHPLPSVIPREC